MTELSVHGVTRVEITPDGACGSKWVTMRIYSKNGEFASVTLFHSEIETLPIITNPARVRQAA